MNYGMGRDLLAKKLGCSAQEADRKIKLYKERYPAVTTFYNGTIALTERLLSAYTILGRRRMIPGIHGPGKIRSRSERTCVNTVIQGSAADIIKMAQLGLDTFGIERYGVRPLLQVHDELVFEVPVDAVEEVRGIVRDWMESPLPTSIGVPLTVSIGVGQSWGTAH